MTVSEFECERGEGWGFTLPVCVALNLNTLLNKPAQCKHSSLHRTPHGADNDSYIVYIINLIRECRDQVLS